MPAAEDRQAKALEDISHSAKELVKIMATMNENFAGAFKYLKEAIERDDQRVYGDDPNQLTLDQLRENAEKAEALARKQRDERAEYEARTGESWAEGPE